MSKTTTSSRRRNPSPVKVTKPDGSVEVFSAPDYKLEIARIVGERPLRPTEIANSSRDGKRSHRAVRLRELGFDSYEAYLQSDLWRAVRSNFIAGLKERCCFVCGDAFRVLHHTDYRNLGRERPRDLVPLCDVCHSGVHSLITSLIAQKRPIKLRVAHLRYRDSYVEQQRQLEAERNQKRPRRTPKKIDPQRERRLSKAARKAQNIERDKRQRSEARQRRRAEALSAARANTERQALAREKRDALRLEHKRLGRPLTRTEADKIIQRISTHRPSENIAPQKAASS